MGKEAVDEVIFRCQSERDRIMLELMARSGMRISEADALHYMDTLHGK